MTEAPRLKMTLWVAGPEGVSSQCTEAVGLEPSRTWRARPETPPEFEREAWLLELTTLDTYEVGVAVDLLLDHLKGHEDRLRQFAERSGIEVAVTCGVHIDNERGIYELKASTMARLASIGARFSMDIFDYRESD